MSGATSPRPRVRAVLSVLGRTASALLVLSLSAAVLAVAMVTPRPQPVEAPAVEVAVPPPASELVCPGPVRLPTEPAPGEDVVYDPAFDPQPGRAVSRLRAVTVSPGDGEPPASGELRPLDSSVEGRTLPAAAGGSATVGAVEAFDGSVVVRAEPGGGLPSMVAGAVGVYTAAGDLRGLAAASCRRPATETWLVGGGTELGSSAWLVLQNPGRTAATVEVAMWGPSGPVDLAGAPEYLVPAGTERALLLEGVAAEQSRIVVRLSSSGGQVAAYLQDSRLRGLVPQGVGYVVGGQAPAVRQVIPGLSVATDAEGGPVGEAGGVGPLLRLLAPGSEPAVAHIALLGPDGIVELPGADRVELAAGAVLDVPLTGLSAGDYAVVVQADQPVVAGVMVTRRDRASDEQDAALDRAWVPSVTAGSSSVLALPAGSRGRLVIADAPGPRGTEDTAAGPEDGTVLEVVGEDGTILGTRTLEPATGATTTLALDGLLTEGAGVDGADVAALVLRTGDPGVVWAAVLSAPGSGRDGGAIAVLVPEPPQTPRPTVGVRIG